MERQRDRGYERSETKNQGANFANREEINVKERKIELFKQKLKSCQDQLREKEKYICDLETKVKECFGWILIIFNFI